MISWLKKHFVPHHANDHRPHILRDVSTKNIIALVIFLEIFSFILPMANFNYLDNLAAVLPSVLGELTNAERASQNLGILAENPLLDEAAEMKARDMATKGYFAHTSPEGLTPWYWIELAGYKYEYAGENLAVNFRDSKDVTEAWLNSPTHKANIVKGNYTEMGTGVARGMYKGKNSIFVAQVYANPKPVPKVAPVPPVAPTVKVDPDRVAEKAPVQKENKVVLASPVEEVVEENVLGAAVAEESTPAPSTGLANMPVKNPSALEKMLASPRNTTNVILAIIFAIVALALLLYIVIKTRDHHRDLLTNGLAVLALIGAIFIANYEYSYRSLIITQSFDYSYQGK